MRAVILDMDGTACNVTSIRHLVTGETRNFHAFHTASVDCPPNADVIDSVKKDQANGLAILVVTARQLRYAPHTMFWLSGPDVELEWNELYMRRDGDFRPDYEVKKDILEMIRADGYEPVKAYEDNPNVLRLWKEEGIPEIVVVEGFGFDD